MARIGSAADRVGAPAPDDPAKPTRVRDLDRRHLKYALKRGSLDFLTHECTDLAAGLTYYGVLAIFPGLLAIVSLLGLVGEAESTSTVLVEVLSGVVPGSTIAVLRDLLVQLQTSSGSGLTLAAGVFGAVWSSSAYIGAMGRALNRVYEIDEGRRWWILRPQQLLIALAVLVLVTLAVLGVGLSGPLARSVVFYLGMGRQTALVLEVVRWPLIIIVAVLLVAALYYGTPNIRQPHLRWVSPGAILAIVVWFVMSLGFMVYVANFGSYNQTYGTLGGVIVFLLWLWLANVALLAGAELDAALERVRQLEGGIAAEDELQLPPREADASADAREQEERLVAEGRELRLDAERPADGPAPQAGPPLEE
ncbi:YihY/virulence factor BrkB family protein [Mariniluteicoccus flavus]